jgi:hypothetical protein
MTKMLAVLALAGAAGAGGVSAGSSSAQMTVGVTVVRSCVVETRADNDAPVLRLTCTTGAQSTLKVSETVPRPSSARSAEGSTLLTLNF